MRYIKKYENDSIYKRKSAFYLSLYNLEESKSEEDYVFYTEEDRDNFIINYVNEEISVAYGEDDVDSKIIVDPEEEGAIKDKYNIPIFIDKLKAMVWYNENTRQGNRSSSCVMNTDSCEIVENIKLDEKVKKLREITKQITKFNL